MWSNLDKTITDFILAFEKALGDLDPEMKDKIPLDNLQVSISLEQQTKPAQVRWHVSVMNGTDEVCDLGHHLEMPL